MNTKLKPLLTLFIFIAHFAVWGQDTIKFEPLHLVDTVYSLDELNKRGNIEYAFYEEDSNFKEIKDSTLFMLQTKDEQFIVKKLNNKWVVYSGFYSTSVYCKKANDRFYINEEIYGRGFQDEVGDSCGSWNSGFSYESVKLLDVKDMRISSDVFYLNYASNFNYELYDRYINYSKEYSDAEKKKEKEKATTCTNRHHSYFAELNFKNNTLIVNVQCVDYSYVIDLETEEEIITEENSHKKCNEEGYLQAGEYHYINGNFVKVK